MRTITPASLDDAADIARAIDQPRIIRRELREAGATSAAKAVARACKSVEGANRHVQHRLQRTR